MSNNDCIPNNLDMRDAFTEVFPDEQLILITYDLQGHRVAMTLKSDKKTRTYEVTPDTNFLELFKNTPVLE